MSSTPCNILNIRPVLKLEVEQCKLRNVGVDTMRFLMIDDEPKCAELALFALQSYFPGCEMMVVPRCADAFKLLSTDFFDAVIIDERLIGETGVNCLRLIRDRWKRMPVVMTTGGPIEFAKTAFKHGADDFVLKEAMKVLLGHCVWAAIERWRSKVQVDESVASETSNLENLRARLNS